MDNRRLILLLIFSFSIVMLWDAWQRQHAAPQPGKQGAAAEVAVPGGGPAAVAVPTTTLGNRPAAASAVSESGAASSYAGPFATIRTDLVVARIAAQGGDLVELDLLKHPDQHDRDKPFRLFDTGTVHVYLGQSGLLGSGMPNHKTTWSGAEGEHVLKDGESAVKVVLQAHGPAGELITKTYTFHRGSYAIDLEIAGVPTGTAYFQILRDGKPAESGAAGFGMGVSTYTGPAVFTDEQKYQKVDFSEIDKGTAKFATKASNGWLAMVQHYFVSALVPTPGVEREYFMQKAAGGQYSAGVVVPVVDGKATTKLYAGPQEQASLTAIAPGLELVVDYGWLSVIAQPLFWVLQWIHRIVGNWGWAIIGLTVLIKAAFFPLSAASYRSMAKMRVLTPKLTKLKETFGDDKQRLNQEMMELYKREKVNPLGGCLPILVQIPVFLALYWVLLGAVEMRNAPWLGWITDLSVRDPYFVLPIVMGVTMLIQTKLNPAPPDPIQAKIMLIMPIVFTGMFLFFPAGLVLYWTVNNLLSIGQQWQITRMVEGAGKRA